jgi:hypothetical protein
VQSHHDPAHAGDEPRGTVEHGRVRRPSGQQTTDRTEDRADGVRRQADGRQKCTATRLLAEQRETEREREPGGAADAPYGPAAPDLRVLAEQPVHTRNVILLDAVSPHHQGRDEPGPDDGQHAFERDGRCGPDRGDQRESGQRCERHHHAHRRFLQGKDLCRPVLCVALVPEGRQQGRVEGPRDGVQPTHGEPGGNHHRRSQQPEHRRHRNDQGGDPLEEQQGRQRARRGESSLQPAAPPGRRDGRESGRSGHQADGPGRAGLCQCEEGERDHSGAVAEVRDRPGSDEPGDREPHTSTVAVLVRAR